jgi:hypothetical protein
MRSAFRVSITMLREIARVDRLRVMGAFPLGLASAVLRLMSAGLLLRFLVSRSDGSVQSPISILGRDFGGRLGPDRLWVWVVLIGGVGVAAAVIANAEVTTQLTLSRRYSILAAERAIGRAARMPSRGHGPFDSSALLWGVPALLSVPSPLVQLAAYLTALFVMNWKLALVLLVLSTLFLGPVTMITSSRIDRSERDRREATGGRKTPEMRIVAGVLAAQEVYDESARLRLLATVLDRSPIVRRIDATYRLRAAQQRVRLFTGVVIAAATVVIALGLGLTAMDNRNNSVDRLLLFAVIAQLAFASISQVAASMAELSKHIVNFEAYQALTGDVLRETRTTDVNTHRGQVWLVEDAGPPRADELSRWLDALGLKPDSAAAVIDEQLADSRVPARLLATGTAHPVSRQLSTAKEFIAAVGGRSASKAFEDDSDELHREVPSTRTALVLAAAAVQQTPLVLILPWTLLTHLTPDGRRAACDFLSHHHVVIVGKRAPAAKALADLVKPGLLQAIRSEALDREPDTIWSDSE